MPTSVSAAWSSAALSSRRLTAASRRLGRKNLSGAGSTTTTTKMNASSKWTMMCTDSRELRFMSGSRVFANSRISSSTTNRQQQQQHPNENASSASSSSFSHNLLYDLSQTYSQAFWGSMASATQQHAPEFISNVSAMATSIIGIGDAMATGETTTTTKTATVEKPAFYFSTRSFTTSSTMHGLGSKFEPPKNEDDNKNDEDANKSASAFPNQNRNNNQNSSTSGARNKIDASAVRSSTTTTTPSPQQRQRQPQTGYGPSIQLTDEERALFELLRRVRIETKLDTTLRVAGGWVRDKLLATPEFQAYHRVFDVRNRRTTEGSSPATTRLTSKFRVGGAGGSSMGRQGTKVLVNNENNCQPVDIDIALDDMLGREFADHLNEYLTAHGKDEVTVGMVLKNPEKSKHLETATMKVASFWIDFVNLRAEEYTQDSRIPDLMRIGTAEEDAFRRDLTINALFFNINTGQVEDWTGRGFQDLRKGIIATPLPPLTTLLDDPLRVLRSIRFAARLRFAMDEELVEAAKTASVGRALAEKVSRERVGGELDLMLRSPDPVGAVRLLINLKLVDCVFPVASHFQEMVAQQLQKAGAAEIPKAKLKQAVAHMTENVFGRGLNLLSTAHDHLADCRWSPPMWCVNKKSSFGATELRLIDDEEARRLLWYAAFLKPLYDDFKIQQQQAKNIPKRQRGSKQAHRCIISKMLTDELKRPGRDADAIQRIMQGADDFTNLIRSGSDVSATMILLSEVHVSYTTASSNSDTALCDVEEEDGDCDYGRLLCFMNGRRVDSTDEEDPVWQHAMEFRLRAASIMRRVGPSWRAALFLSIAEDLVESEKIDDMEYTIEGDVFDDSQEQLRQGVMERFDVFAAALQQVGVIGIWNEKPILDGDAIKHVLPRIPKGPAFRNVMDEELRWMTTHPGGGADALEKHLMRTFPDFAPENRSDDGVARKAKLYKPEDDGSWL